MALADAANRPPTPPTFGGTCSIRKLYDQLPESEAEALRTLLSQPRTNREISNLLKDEGYPVGDYTIRRHRAGGCTCGSL